MSEAWYETVNAEAGLTQGDLIFGCPLLTWEAFPLGLEIGMDGETLRGIARGIQHDVVVMTQACDLANKRVNDVVLCPHHSLGEFRQLWERRIDKPAEKAWNSYCRNIANGFVWNLAMLDFAQLGDNRWDIRIVDFSRVYTVPREFLESLILRRGEPRLRLLPPFREHLSQAFARFFMRVGLPVPIEGTWQ